MEKEAKAPKAKAGAKKPQSADIRAKYKEYVLENGAAPSSFFLFAKSLKLKEEDLYEFYNSFESIEKGIWYDFVSATIQAIESEKVYDEYSVREKLLAFYYTLIEELKRNRSYILWQMQAVRHPTTTPYFLKAFKSEFLSWANNLVIEGKDTDEIANRPFISDRYGEAMWVQTLFILNFWHKDESKGFEKTDAAIEKAVNLAFDLMGRGAVDSLLDLAKFIYRSKKEA
ncbi:TetR family transcriptional regulator C-terminal domain-containing protein [uncultured Imperialibacter sp.]|uniref:TetR family transcriptional regulator C-terminal domain-containing protein n=1 Tax=uncultured Imperialibacter sp. TaxID=1672639 RepID=UPI0030D8D3C0|tara:strand:- start:3115 stop:3798 length:684 start_codon:yes stop_codon:yes gene_type:complete